MESLRAFGYGYDAAIEDVIDNSVTAEASLIRVGFVWAGRDATVMVADDGCGMTPAALKQAMRLGARSPLEERAAGDLGRFGLGMKTASFSQARRLTVATRTQPGAAAIAVWDLDVIRETGSWSMGTTPTPVAAELIEAELPERGTVVVWEKLDRLVGDVEASNEEARSAFFERIDRLARVLGVTYHRRLQGAGSIRMEVNGEEVVPWDPFLTGHMRTQTMPTEELPTGDGRRISVSAYVLPHHSALSQAEHKDAEGPRGWNSHQGLFVYRDRRLIVDGGWLDLGFRQEDHYKLARVRVDLDNRDDHAWQIDVRKEQARVPDALRHDLRRVAKAVRKRAEEVYRHRGTVIRGPSQGDTTHVWQMKRTHGRTRYVVNRDHPLVKDVRSRAGAARVTALLRLVEETVPVTDIALDHSRNPDSFDGPFTGVTRTQLQKDTRELFNALVGQGRDPVDALRFMGSMEPCLSHPDLLAHLKEELDHDSADD